MQPAEQVIERQHRVRLATAEVGLEFNHRVAVSGEGGSELTQAGQRALTASFLLGAVQAWSRRWWRLGWRRRAQAQAADLEVFLEAVGLEEVGEFEGADVAALSLGFALEVGDDGAEFLAGVTGVFRFTIIWERVIVIMAEERAASIVIIQESSEPRFANRGDPSASLGPTPEGCTGLTTSRPGGGRLPLLQGAKERS